MRRAQLGASGLFVAVILILVGVAALAIFALANLRTGVDRGGGVSDGMNRTRAALLAFVALNGRLPCPARPSLDTGDSDPDTATATCNFPVGTLPWRTLGLRREDSLDSWANRISYRVYTGTAGALTQAEGASLVNCDTRTLAPTLGVEPGAGSAGNTCRVNHDTSEAAYNALGKGFRVHDRAGVAVTTEAAYVLISHGANGLSAYTSAGVQGPAATGANELANATASDGPFFESSTDDGFDDVVVYAGLSDLIRAAHRDARPWPSNDSKAVAVGGYSSVRLDAATIGGVLGSTPGTGSLGTTSLTIGGATVTGRNGGGDQTLSFTTSGADGIGVGGGSASSGSGEYFRIDLPQKAGKFAFTAANFGMTNFSGTIYREQVQVIFYDGTTNVGTVTKQGCRFGSNVTASFSLDSIVLNGAQFNSVELKPVIAYPGFFNSSFFLNEFKTCSASDSSCVTSLATGTNTCP